SGETSVPNPMFAGTRGLPLNPVAAWPAAFPPSVGGASARAEVQKHKVIRRAMETSPLPKPREGGTKCPDRNGGGPRPLPAPRWQRFGPRRRTTGMQLHCIHDLRCQTGPSALSQLDFGVDRREFAAGVVDLHLPVDPALGAVDVG